jgi:hypothetical protein
VFTGMSSGPRRALLLAAALMAVGTALPWGWARTAPWNEVVTVGAFGGGGGDVVLLLAAALALAAVLRRPAAAVLVALCAALVLVVFAWEAPGRQIAGAYETGAGLGLSLALLGTLVACGAAVAIVVRGFNEAALAAMARRAAARARWSA